VRYRFLDFELDPDRLELCRNGRAVSLPSKPRQLLLHLLQRHPSAVSRRELIDSLWPDVRVTPDSLESAVHRLRRALGERGRAARIVRTVRAHGYVIGVDVHASPARGATGPRGDGEWPQDTDISGLRARLLSMQSSGARIRQLLPTGRIREIEIELAGLQRELDAALGMTSDAGEEASPPATPLPGAACGPGPGSRGSR